MPSSRPYIRSFAGGEISANMQGRIDDIRFQTGAALLQNFISTPQGPVQNRSGLAYVATTKYSAASPSRLIPFVYSETQTMVVELGLAYIRFYTRGQRLLYTMPTNAFRPSAVVTYTIASPALFTQTAHGYTGGEMVVLAKVGTAPPGQVTSYPAGVGYGPYQVIYSDANTYNLFDQSTGTFVAITAAPAYGSLAVQPLYAVGDLALYSGAAYYRTTVPPSSVLTAGALDTNPATDGYWYALPSDLTYEIPSPFGAGDLFSIHYVQSADVMTLVHPSYQPMELRRLGATNWTLTPINFGATLDAPTGVSVTASPGYIAQIQSSSEVAATGSQPAHTLFTTASAHTLALASAVYVKGLFASGGADLTDFYLVAGVPADPTTGSLITNQFWLMDYSGNTISGVSPVTLSPGTVQLGSKVYDPNNYYAVTAIAADGVSQSALSATVQVVNNLNVPGSYNVISWAPVSGAASYYVYQRRNGLWGFIGEAVGTTFTDTNISADFTITPPNFDNPFNGTNNYPAAVSYVEQRRSFGGTNNSPQTYYETNFGTESTFAYSLPTRETDRIQIKIASREVSKIQHIVPLAQPLLLTSSCEYGVYTTSGGPITPTTIGVRPQSYVGSSPVQPSVVNTSVVYCAARGGHVREMQYSFEQSGYVTGDLSLRNVDRFDNLTIADMAYSKAPLPILWFVSSNGTLLGLTYVPEQQIAGWHAHVTQGTFESVCCVAEGSEERLYAVVRRVINGQPVRYIERMASRLVSTLPECFFVDAGATYRASNPVFQNDNNLELSTWIQPGAVGNDPGNTATGTFLQTPGSPATWSAAGNGPYANGYWYIDLGTDAAAALTSLNTLNFSYEIIISFPTQNDIDRCQAFEFELQAYFKGTDSIRNMAIQCDLGDTGQFRYFTYTGSTVPGMGGSWHTFPTALPFTRSMLSPGVELHLIATFSTGSDGAGNPTVTHQSLSLNGVPHPIGVTQPAVLATSGNGNVSSVSSVHAGFQLDCNGDPTPPMYTVRTRQMNAQISTPSTTSTISGLTWLEGCKVSVLADGAVQNQKVVTGGAITLDNPASVVQIGLPYNSDLQTLPAVLQVDGFGQGRKKIISDISLRVYESSGIFVGPTFDSLTEDPQRTNEPYGTPPSLLTSVREIVVDDAWNDEGQICIRQSLPLPLTVTSVTLDITTGG